VADGGNLDVAKLNAAGGVLFYEGVHDFLG
jgi:hypothetical protein